MFYYQEAQRQAVANGEYGKVKQINQIIERILIAEQKLRKECQFSGCCGTVRFAYDFLACRKG